MIDYTTTELVASVKRKALTPTSQNLYTPAEICKIMTEELHAVIVPLIMKTNEEYFVANYDQAIVTTQAAYYLPTRAVGQKLRDVVLVDSSGNEIPITRLRPEEIKEDSQKAGFFFDADRVNLRPDASALSGYTIRMKYFRRPNNLVITSNAGKITVINTGTNVVSLNNAPSSWTTATALDVIKGTPGFKAWAENQTITLVSGFDLTFSSLPAGMAVGDWVAEDGYSPIPQIPFDVFPLLVQRTVIRLLDAMGDAKLASAGELYTDMKNEIFPMLTPRAEGSLQRIVSKSGISSYTGV